LLSQPQLQGLARVAVADAALTASIEEIYRQPKNCIADGRRRLMAAQKNHSIRLRVRRRADVSS
jgi:hypothetical protein